MENGISRKFNNIKFDVNKSMSVREQFLAKRFDTKKVIFKGSDNEIKRKRPKGSETIRNEKVDPQKAAIRDKTR